MPVQGVKGKADTADVTGRDGSLDMFARCVQRPRLCNEQVCTAVLVDTAC
jgi:hypothetical protein